jgi:hypothetical protein
MSKQKEASRTTGDLVAVPPIREITVLPPNSGVVGRFLEEVQNMFKARAMRMGGLLARINESGHRTELMLRMGAERMEAAEARLQQDLRKQGLVEETENAENPDE